MKRLITVLFAATIIAGSTAAFADGRDHGSYRDHGDARPERVVVRTDDRDNKDFRRDDRDSRWNDRKDGLRFQISFGRDHGCR